MNSNDEKIIRRLLRNLEKIAGTAGFENMQEEMDCMQCIQVTRGYLGMPSCNQDGDSAATLNECFDFWIPGYNAAHRQGKSMVARAFQATG